MHAQLYVKKNRLKIVEHKQYAVNGVLNQRFKSALLPSRIEHKRTPRQSKSLKTGIALTEIKIRHDYKMAKKVQKLYKKLQANMSGSLIL